MHFLPLALLALLGGEQIVDDFRYVDVESVRAAWRAGEGSPPAKLVEDGGRPIVELARPFAAQSKLRRTVADRRVKLDLAAPTGFLLEAAVDDPKTVGSLMLYFRSGDGWYASSKPVAKKGWQSLSFPKALFGVEGKPSGWDKIDRIRLSVWRPADKTASDTAIRFRRLAATWHDVAVIIPTASKSQLVQKRRSSWEIQTVAALLDELGLGADALDENSVVEGAIARRSIAVLPSRLMPGDRCVEALTRFVESGGKVVAYSVLPPQLREVLRLGDQPAARAAVQRSDRGVLFGHAVLSDSREGRNELAAALGGLAPPLWKEMARDVLDSAGKVGHCKDLSQVIECVKPRTTAVADHLARATSNLASAKESFALGEYAKATASALAAHDLLVKAYLLAAESLTREGRAVWCNPCTGPYPGDWDRTAKLLADNGFNMVLPIMLTAGVAHYRSDVLPRSAIFRKYGDQLDQCCAAARKHGLEVHVWNVTFNLEDASKDFVERLRRDGRTQVTAEGKPMDWLCPSHPDNRKLELESMLEIARKYPVDGLHFDYIRYPVRECCYCDGCRQRFEAESGRPVADWPKECYSGERKKEYGDWRCRQITSLVAAVSREAKKIRPGLKISAAVFGSYPYCRDAKGQDWPAWIKAGYLDFVCPMDYTNSDTEFASLVRSQMKLIGGRVPLYAGIGAGSSVSTLGPDRVVGQILLARSLGAAGFTIFNLDALTAAEIVPAVGLGAGSRTAVPPHRTVPPMVPNSDFSQGDSAPAGWTLSGGQGRWVDRHILEVTGNGSDSNQWQCACHFVPGGLYRFQMRARSIDGIRAGFSGPAFANRDQALSESWAWYGHVFRVPDGVANDDLRIGQWHAAGTCQFDAVRLVPVVPVHAAVGLLRLGDGETIRAGRYTFSGEFSHEGSNYHRTLHRATAGFNTNRWCFWGNCQVTYRFGMPGYPLRSGNVRLSVNYHERGGCLAEISRDQVAWRLLATQTGVGTATADVPTDMLPADVLYLRLRTSAPNSAFQVNNIEFSATLVGTPPEVTGRTEFAEITNAADDLAVEEITLDLTKGHTRPMIRLTAKNRRPSALQTTLSWQMARRQSGAGAKQQNPAPDQFGPPLSVPPVSLAPSETHTFVAEVPLAHPGPYDVRLTLRAADHDVYVATVPLVLPEYYREDYGRRIEGVEGETEVWWCAATWKIARQRPSPQKSSPAATLSAARNDREAVQVVIRPTKPLRQLTAAAEAFVGPDGATIPADNVQVLQVYYHPVRTPTDETGVRADWPDALPPLDKPLDLPAGKNQPLWVLVYVPKDAQPGDYTGRLTLKAEGWSAAVPLRLHVWNFALPERNHIETAWGMSPDKIFRYHNLKSDADRRRVLEMYLQNFAEHRISPQNPTPLDPIRVKFLPEANPPRAELDFSAFDAEMTRVLAKYHFTNFVLPIEGMGWGNYENRNKPQIGNFGEKTPQYQAMFASCVKQLESHLREKGWLKMAYVYWFDEPEPKDYAFVQAGVDRIKKYAPGLQTFITKHELQKDWNGTIDIWCPLTPNYNHANAQQRRAHGERFWWYVCCGPHAPYCTLFIDHPATDLRAWLWQTWQRKIVGVLVWESTYWTARPDFAQNPYEDPMTYTEGTRPEENTYWGNGDGRFLYPPLAAAAPGISGDKPVIEPPVFCIRWEMLREGIEDYEFLWMLRDLIDKKRGSLTVQQVKAYESLLEVPASITRDVTTFSTDPAPIYARRAAVAEAIEQLMN